MSTMTERDKLLVALANGQRGFVTKKQLFALGFTPRTISTREQHGSLSDAIPGVYRLPGADSGWLGRVMTIHLAVGHDAVVSHSSAARLWELDLPIRDRVEMTILHSRHVSPRLPGHARIHRSRHLPDSHTTQLCGFRVTSAERTLVDVAPRFGDERLRKALDGAILGHVVQLNTLSELLAEQSMKVRRRSQVLRAALAPWLDGLEGIRRVDSVSEAALFRVLRSAGVPAPVPQLKTLDGSRVVGVADFGWPEYRIAVEMDGFRYHASPKDHAHDRLRANRLAALGWEVLRITPWELDCTPGPFLAALRSRLDR
jgi:very-short-patch-repair endonuclease